MSQHHHDPVEENIETHPVKLAIAVTAGAVGLIVGIIMLAYFAVGTHSVGAGEAKANTAEAIAQRVAPVATLEVARDAASTPVPAAAAAPASAKAGTTVVAAIPAAPPTAKVTAAASGESVYKASCSACHATGVAGAPKAGDKAAWAPRIAKGAALLHEHALKGFNNVMPAKGGNPALSDADVKSAVDYMVAQAK